MFVEPRKFYLGGEWTFSAGARKVLNPFSGEVAGEVCQADAGAIERAIELAQGVFPLTRSLASYQRQSILRQIARDIERRREEFARLITLETGKPITASRSEVERTVFTFIVASEEAGRITGDVLPLDLNLQSAGRFGLACRFPLGPVAAITPFNFPLNLVAHKLGPALAVGNPVLLKPSSNAPMTSLLLAAIIAESEWPRAALSVLPCLSEEADQLVIDERIKLVTFTGSPSVGWTLKSRAGRKRVVLELGGNAGVIVEKDADVADALTRIVAGAFANAGQSCISVQRVFVHREILPAFERALLEHVRNLVVGNPNNEATIVGPMITEAAAVQAEDWVREAVDAGARLLCGGSREAAVLQPTVLSGVRKDLPVSCCEVFAPVMILEGFLDFHDAVEQVNDSDFGLQAGVFTNDLRKVLQAYRDLDVGGVIINDVPTYRIDHMPYGGVKHSGFGREGIRYAMEEMTELKLLAVNPR